MMYAVIFLKAILVVLLVDAAPALELNLPGISIGLNVDANCVFEQHMEIDKTYYIYSPNYPGNYSAGTTCSWIVQSPAGHSCKLDCTVNLPQSPDCKQDRLLISKSGDHQLVDAGRYCGRGTLTITSTASCISVGLIVSSQSDGGRFLCHLRAVKRTDQPTCSCGYKKTNRIVGGKETEINEYPMVAGLVDVEEKQVVCGATILCGNYALTAAICLLYRIVEQTAVLVGEHDVTKADSSATTLIPAAGFVIHPLYSEQNNDNNIALVKVKKPIEFSGRVGPVCLPFKFTSEDFAGKEVTTIGWGATRPGGDLSNMLRKVVSTVISPAACKAAQSTYVPSQMCTNTTGSKGPCKYDKGGPVLYTDPDTGLEFLVGLVSQDNCCGETPVCTNTRITPFLGWIVENVPDQICVK